jgi:hypothetical protein
MKFSQLINLKTNPFLFFPITRLLNTDLLITSDLNIILNSTLFKISLFSSRYEFIHLEDALSEFLNMKEALDCIIGVVQSYQMNINVPLSSKRDSSDSSVIHFIQHCINVK